MRVYDTTQKPTPELEKRFSYHPPRDDQVERYEGICECARALGVLLNTGCPPSRELSLAFTKLEECVMWSNAAIARNEVEDANTA